MVVGQGQIWWTDLPEPVGSGPGFRRPVVVVQGDSFNQSRIATVVCVLVTSNVRLANVPGNVLISARATGLPRDSVANVSQIVTLDKDVLTDHVGDVSRAQLRLILADIDLVLGRWVARQPRSGLSLHEERIPKFAQHFLLAAGPGVRRDLRARRAVLRRRPLGGYGLGDGG